MKTLLPLLALLVITTCHAQYLPADSSFYRNSPPVTDLELRVRRLEFCTQAFEKQTRVAKHLMLASGVCLVVGGTRVNRQPLDPIGWITSMTGMIGMTTGNILLFDAPRVLRAEKIRRRREL